MSAAQDDAFMAYTPSDRSCGSFVSASPVAKRNYEAWFLGFASGAGYAALPLRHTDSLGITNWVAKYCADHPLDSIIAAAIALVSELRLPPAQ